MDTQEGLWSPDTVSCGLGPLLPNKCHRENKSCLRITEAPTALGPGMSWFCKGADSRAGRRPGWPWPWVGPWTQTAFSSEDRGRLTLGYVGTSRRGVNFLLLSKKLYLQGQLVLKRKAKVHSNAAASCCHLGGGLWGPHQSKNKPKPQNLNKVKPHKPLRSYVLGR